MGTVLRDCPHCHATSSTFTGFADFPIPNTRLLYLSAFSCGNCHGGLFVEALLNGQDISPSSYKGNIQEKDDFVLRSEYPMPSSTEAPKYLPDNIRSFFLQAAESLKAKSYDASSMMARKTLEVAVKKLNPKSSGDLKSRIETLHNKGLITDDLKAWAHIIRDDGNEAAHEEEPVEEKFAEELLSFTELFLMYTFTMPGMVKEKKGISEEENQEGNETE